VIRFVAFISIITLSLTASQAIEKRISESKKTLQNTQKEKILTSRQLSKIAKSIKRAREELNRREDMLDELEKKQLESQKSYKEAIAKINRVQNKIDALDRYIRKKYDRFIRLITKQFSMVIALEQINKQSERSVILREFYEKYKEIYDKELSRLKEEIDKSKKQKLSLLLERGKLKQDIDSLVKERKEYLKKLKETQELLKSLQKSEALYRQKLKSIIAKQNLLQLTLAKLNILKKEEIEAIKRQEEERKRELAIRAKQLERLREQRAKERERARVEGRKADFSKITIPSYKPKTKVKQYGSSYQKEKVARYRGPKTIPPFRGARVVKKFGTYIDPIYKIKIFNDSITLKAPAPDTNVRTVFNGKVVYVGQNSMLGRVVIIQHANGVHTVYAGLSKISPVVRTGKRVRKGTVIGKVKKKLIFQATQNEKLINPLRLIKL